MVVFLGYSSFSHSSYLVSAKWRGWGQGNIEEKEGGGVPHKPLERKRALTFSSPSRGRDERMSDGRKPRRGKMSSPSICIRLSHSAAANEQGKEIFYSLCPSSCLYSGTSVYKNNNDIQQQTISHSRWFLVIRGPSPMDHKFDDYGKSEREVTKQKKEKLRRP